MSHDLQMARGGAEGEYNLAIGEPHFLQQLMLKYMLVTQIPYKNSHYPAVGGEPELLEELHRAYPQYEHIVVTNGAKQAIEAAFFAFKNLEHMTTVLHQAPYWPSYATLAKSQDLAFNLKNLSRFHTILCVTSPNNPDGRQEYLFKSLPEIWDAAYAQPLYGYQGIAPPHRVGIFSAAKLLGLSGLRVGWLGTNEPEIAEKAAYFVEITTSGVATGSQMQLAGCLKAWRDPNQMSVLTPRSFEARAALMTNGNTFTEILSDIVEDVHGVPKNGSGMFAWFKARRPEAFARALKDAKVKLVTGEACGVSTPGYYRMSMGQMPEVTREALLRVKDEYYRGWVGQ